MNMCLRRDSHHESLLISGSDAFEEDNLEDWKIFWGGADFVYINIDEISANSRTKNFVIDAECKNYNFMSDSVIGFNLFSLYFCISLSKTSHVKISSSFS